MKASLLEIRKRLQTLYEKLFFFVGKADKVLERDNQRTGGVKGKPVKALHCQGEGHGDKQTVQGAGGHHKQRHHKGLEFKRSYLLNFWSWIYSFEHNDIRKHLFNEVLLCKYVHINHPFVCNFGIDVFGTYLE